MRYIYQKIKKIKNHDIFGHPIGLTMNQHDTYQTVFGGILSLIVQSFFFIVIIYSLYKLFDLQNFETYQSQVSLGSNYGSIEMKQETINFALKFDQPVLNNWTIPFMNITAVHVTQFRNSSTTFKIKKKIILKQCEYSDFQGDHNVQFDQLGLNTSLCPLPGTNLTIQGNFQEDVFSYVQFILTACNDSSLCQSSKKINSTMAKIDKTKLQFFILNNIIDAQNILHPISQNIISDIFLLIDPVKPFYATADVFLNEVQISTDFGFFPTLFPEVTTNKTFTYNNEMKPQTVFNDPNQFKYYISDIYFRKSPTKYVYSRQLGDFWALVSYLAGTWSTVYIWFMVFIRAYNRNFFIYSLSNKLYCFPSQKKQRKKETFELSGYEQSQNKSVYQKILEKIEIYLSYEKKLKVRFFSMCKYMIKNIFSFINFKDEKTFLLNKSQESLMCDLDVCNILKKLQEFEKVKNILFTEDQQYVLSFSPKPDILTAIEETTMKKNNKSGIKHLSKKKRHYKRKNRGRFLSDQINFEEMLPFKNLILAWKALKSSDQKNFSVNENLIKLFGEEFSTIVEVTEDDLKTFSLREQGTLGTRFFKAVKKATNKNDDETELKKSTDLDRKVDNEKKYMAIELSPLDTENKNKNTNEVIKYKSMKDDNKSFTEHTKSLRDSKSMKYSKSMKESISIKKEENIGESKKLSDDIKPMKTEKNNSKKNSQSSKKGSENFGSPVNSQKIMINPLPENKNIEENNFDKEEKRKEIDDSHNYATNLDSSERKIKDDINDNLGSFSNFDFANIKMFYEQNVKPQTKKF